jgi:membrane protein YdbS with pleckstrin-like domain
MCQAGIMTNDALPSPGGSLIRTSLRPPALLVSRRAVAYWTLRAVPGWLIVTVPQIIFIAMGSYGNQDVRIVVLAATVVLAVAHLLVMPRWRYRVHRWEKTSDAVYTQAGWFNTERRIAPVSRIQTVDSHIGPFERLFKLANVTVTTASAAGPVKIHGLDRVTAQGLVDDLISTTQATPGDAT